MVFAIILNRNCNLNCTYCYQKNKNVSVMSHRIIIDTVDFIRKEIIEKKLNSTKINISGGECFLYPNKVKTLVKRIREIEKEISFCKIEIEISTNITLLTKEMLVFLNKEKICLYLSFDGVKKSQDLNRKLKNHELGTYNICKEKLEFITTYGYRKNIVINSVITSNNIKYLIKTFTFFSKAYPKFIFSFNIAYNSSWNWISLFLLIIQLRRLAKMYVSYVFKNLNFSIGLFDRQIRTFLMSTIKDTIQTCDAGKDSICITPEGKLLGCSSCIGMNIENDFYVGSIYRGIEKKLIQSLEKILKNEIPSSCLKCKLINKCYIYCPVTNTLAGDRRKVGPKECKINRILINNAKFILEKLYKKNPKLIKDKFF